MEKYTLIPWLSMNFFFGSNNAQSVRKLVQDSGGELFPALSCFQQDWPEQASLLPQGREILRSTFCDWHMQGRQSPGKKHCFMFYQLKRYAASCAILHTKCYITPCWSNWLKGNLNQVWVLDTMTLLFNHNRIVYTVLIAL